MIDVREVFSRGFYSQRIKQPRTLQSVCCSVLGCFLLAESIEFTCDETLWNIKRFESYDKEWLDFVAGCREGMDTGNYDMIIGGIANDRVIITLDRYFTGEISQEEALGLLRFEKPNIQYCIRTDKMLQKCLTFIGSEQL